MKITKGRIFNHRDGMKELDVFLDEFYTSNIIRILRTLTDNELELHQWESKRRQLREGKK